MPSLNVLVPVYNEARTLERVMDALTVALPESRIIYVNDGSTDGTKDILEKKKRPQDTVIARADADYCVIQDADLEYDPAEIKDLLKAAGSGNGIVFGSRFLRPNANIYPLYLLGNKTLTFILNCLFCGRLTDSYTCYKLFPTKVLQSLPLKADGFELEAELAALPLKMGYGVTEVPVSYHPRTFEEGKKIGARDAVKGILTMLRIRFMRIQKAQA
jgi:glycosyltransferase involved in cell wall biosynthesis